MTTPPPRRRRLARVAAVLSLLAVAWVLYAWQVEPRRLVVQRDTIAGTGIPPLDVAVVADLHHGMHPMDDARVREVVARVNGLGADVTVLLGDYHASVGPAEDVAPERTARLLGALRAPLGVYAVIGNHDRWKDAARTERALTAAGIRVLENRGILLPGRRVWLAGLADDFSGLPDEAAALRGAPPDAPVLAITHSPDVFPRLSTRVALTLAAHTHGGQLLLPFVGAPWAPSQFGQRYLRGTYRRGPSALYVSSGVGQSVVPLRFRVPPEVNLVRVRP
ncbi:MAG: metallophosphoesterase [Polyangiales bacterium]